MRTPRGAAYEIEMIAKPDLLPVVLVEQCTDTLEECNRDSAPHTAAIEAVEPSLITLCPKSKVPLAMLAAAFSI